ncbi:exosome complex component RRP43-like [Leguminivora glycinivorella]|uniref:exosome complex component RRP43-like n=1 Tax=Leguminivora glycinivorella TaxID=1035111 RepID=UPI00200D7F8F|nr:exosome complex component RRP43-like [Leguminivora glycinivorella]
MAEIYKLIHPVKHFNDYISRDIRPDGRKFQEQRNLKLNVDSLKTADASAVVKCGNTTVVCGIKLELAIPKAEEPDVGYVITNVELPPLCSSKYRPGPPSDHAQITSNLVSDIFINSTCVDLKDLCIVPDKLAWVLYCDMVCLDNDGSLVDACIMTLIASLKTLSLPHVIYDQETEDFTVDTTVTKPLKVHGMPVATSFAVYQSNQSNVILTDPSSYEEDMCGGIGSNLIVCYNNGTLCGVQKLGGRNLSKDIQEDALKIARQRSKLVEEVITTCIQNQLKS